ncbi:MAG: helix-turn-helix domain-containing protein [Verrucomicrobiota bacterium]
MLPIKNKSVHFEDVPAEIGASFTVRQFDLPNFPFNWHYHPEVELALIVRGRGMRFIGDSAEKFTDGDLCLVGANTPHCWASEKDSESGVQSIVVHFRPETWSENFWKLPELRGATQLLAEARRGLLIDGPTRRDVEKLMIILQQEQAGSLQRLSTLLEILHSLAQSQDIRPLAASTYEAPASAEVNGKLGKILNYIHDHLGPDLTQSEVAKAVRLSPAAFSQFIRRSLGTSYVHYVNEIKIRNAARALLDTDQPITEIAYQAGFNNLSHFNAQFRRFRQLSPRAFRQQAQAAERAGIPMEATTLEAPSAVANFKRDVTVHAKGTAFEGVRVGTEDPRPWLKHYSVCPALATHQIVHTGIAQTLPPYQIVRTNQTTSYFLACFGGRGQVLVDGKWRTIRPGMACLLPAHAPTAFEALPGEPWRFVYVCYGDQSPQSSKFNASSPVMAEFNVEVLHLAIQGLTAECRRRTGSSQEEHWLELMQGYVQAFMQPNPKTSPLPTLWQRVASRLQEAWTEDALAVEAKCSGETLRRLCIQELGRSPLQHLISLRMRKATELLAGTTLPLNKIAVTVGYADPATFSKIFQLNIGCRPTEYRKRAANLD